MTNFKDEVFRQEHGGSSVGLFAAVLVTLIGLAGCGGGGDDGAASTPTVPSPVAASGISVFAGGLGGGGSADGTPGRFANPSSLALDSKGNIFVIDSGNCRVGKVVGNVVSTLYADRTCNVSDFQAPIGDPFRAVVYGPADSVYFVKSQGLFKIAADGTVLPNPILVPGISGAFAFDEAGTLFAVDEFENAIYQISADGTRTLIAGGNRVPRGGPFFADGVGSAARFYGPRGIAIGTDGIIYVADTGNHVVRKVTRQGVVTTLAGNPNIFGSADGLGNAAQFFGLNAIAVDRSGNVYVAGRDAAIRKITPAGAVTTLAGSFNVPGALDGAGAAARFSSVASIAVNESGVLFAADAGNGAIRRISPDGNVTTIAGALRSTGVIDATGTAARFSSPGQLAIDATDNIYVADTENRMIRKISPTGAVTTLAGTPNTSEVIDSLGTAAGFNKPVGIAVDKLGNSYATEYDRRLIRKITSGGQVSTLKDYSLTVDVLPLAFNLGSVAVDSLSNIYFVANPANVISYLAKTTSTGADSLVSCGTACNPRVVATDTPGNIYVVASGTIKRIAPDRTVVNLAGDAAVERRGYADGTGAAAIFKDPLGLATDNKGNVFVADTDNHTVRKVTAAGVVTTIAGRAGVSGVATGSLPGLLNAPRGIVVDSAGNLFVTTEDAVVKIIQ